MWPVDVKIVYCPERNHTHLQYLRQMYTQTHTYLHDQLVGTGYQCEAVGVVECLGDVLAKGVAGSTRRDAPATAVVRVRPQQVTHGALHEEEEEEEGGDL